MEAAEQETEALARRYAHRVRFFANKVQRSFMLSPHLSDELLSAGYWGLFKALRDRRQDVHEQQLSAYVSIRIHGAVVDAARTCISQVLKREVMIGSPDEMERSDSAGGPLSGPWQTRPVVRDPEELAARVWKRSAIRQALSQLSADDRRTIVAYMEGATLPEIAREQGVALGTMQSRFRKLARCLRVRAPELRRVLLDRESC